jgi:hypothetical protein
MSNYHIQEEVLSKIISRLERASHLYDGFACALDPSMLEEELAQLSAAERALNTSIYDLKKLIKKQ